MMTRAAGAAAAGGLVLLSGLTLTAGNGQSVRDAPPRVIRVVDKKIDKKADKQVDRTTAVQGRAPLSLDTQSALVKQYCTGCHNDSVKAGRLTLVDFDPAHLERHAEIAEKMIRKLRAGMMPPPAAKRPDGDMLMAFAATLEARIDAAAVGQPHAGRRSFQRLNRVEYARLIRNLLGIDVDVDAFLPSDTVSSGFDNIADAQSFSPTLMMGYLRAASQIGRLAVGDVQATPSPATYQVPEAEGQMRRVDGAPMGTRGGISIVHIFPADGDYVFQMSFVNAGEGELFGSTTISSTDRGEQIEVSVNGARAQLFDIDPWMDESNPEGLTLRTKPVHIKAGPQRVSAAFIRRYAGPIDDMVAPIEFTLANPRMGKYYGVTALPHLRDLTITGPSRVTGVSETPSRRRIFSCHPSKASEERACASAILKRLAATAYRAPIADADVEPLLRLFANERKETTFESAIRVALEGILTSPRFLFRLEQTPLIPDGARTYRIGGVALASRLSFFLWGTGPDPALVTLASRGALKNPALLETQVRSMLADRRAEALSTRFARQWLRLQDVEKISPDAQLYPHYDHYLSDSYVRETELFFNSVVREDRNVLDLLTADYSFVNERIARNYGIPGVVGDDFRRVSLPPERRGILGQGSVLLQTSVANRTSPVIRGKWIMEVLLGSPPPPPPPNVPPFDETNAVSDAKTLSVRERMERHRANPACSSCHRVIDPPGLALENFDATGRWRAKDNGVAIDATGQLYDGARIDGPAGLRDALLRHADVVLLSFAENLMTYALGRRVEYGDMPAIRTIVGDAARQGNRLSAFVLGVVKSPAFQMSDVDASSTIEGAAFPSKSASR